MDYPERDARLDMLGLLHELLEEARARGHAKHGKLWLEYYSGRRGRTTRLEMRNPRSDIAEKLGIGGDEAYGRLKDLYDDEYLRLSFDSAGPDASGMVGVTFTEKGRAAIRNLPSSLGEDPAVPASQEELGAIKARLRQQDFATALNHLNQAESAFNRREWESANAQIRSCLEAVFDGVAGTRLRSTKTGGAARKELEERGLLPKYEARLVQHFINVAGGAGSHAGRSNEDEARGRFLAGLGICYIGLSLIPLTD